MRTDGAQSGVAAVVEGEEVLRAPDIQEQLLLNVRWRQQATPNGRSLIGKSGT
jgi:hypothetical protein